MKIEAHFSQSDLEAIVHAAQNAEARTSAELVPYVVAQCDVYESPLWKGATAGAILGALIAGAIHLRGGFWGGHPLVWTTLPTIAGAILGLVPVSIWPALQRALIDQAVLEARVRRRAQAAFLEEQVFLTRERTGILIFLARFERRVVVLGDSGIHAKVSPGEWDAITDGIVFGLKRGRAAEALCQALEQCGALLERHGLARPRDDRNELADDLRMRDQ